MKKHEDKAYERYKQYRINKYRYEQEQIIFPVAIILGGTILFSLWKYILFAIAAISVVAIVAILLYLYLKKQVTSQQVIVLSKESAQEGATLNMNVTYKERVAAFDFGIPAGVKDGQKFVAKNILFEDANGKKVKKNVHFKVQVK